MSAAIDLDTKLLLGVDLFGSHGTDLAAVFLDGFSGKHDLSEAVFSLMVSAIGLPLVD